MRKIQIVFVVTVILFGCGLALAEETTKSKSDASAILNFSPTSNYTSDPMKRDHIQSNAYSGYVQSVQPFFAGDWKIFRDQAMEKTWNTMNWSEYKLRGSNPFKKIRTGLSYFFGQIDRMAPESRKIFKKVTRTAGPIHFLDQRPTNSEVVGFKILRSPEGEDVRNTITEIIADLEQATNSENMVIEIKPVNEAFSSSGTVSMQPIYSTIVNPAGGSDTKEFAVSVYGGSGETKAWYDIVYDVRITAYDKVEEEVKTGQTETKASTIVIAAPAEEKPDRSAELEKKMQKLFNIHEDKIQSLKNRVGQLEDVNKYEFELTTVYIEYSKDAVNLSARHKAAIKTQIFDKSAEIEYVQMVAHSSVGNAKRSSELESKRIDNITKFFTENSSIKMKEPAKGGTTKNFCNNNNVVAIIKWKE